MTDFFERSGMRGSARSWPRGQVREVRAIGDPVLRSPCDEVRTFDAGLERLVEDMFVTMYAAEGVGLAANQVGVGRQAFVYDCSDDNDVWHRGALVNPVVVEEGGELDELEGCLSLPGFSTRLVRPDRVSVRGQDVAGHPVEITGTGYFARCLRHEVDHLHGRLFTDLVTGESRKAALRAIRNLSARS